jgi:hypothetical protein
LAGLLPEIVQNQGGFAREGKAVAGRFGRYGGVIPTADGVFSVIVPRFDWEGVAVERCDEGHS